MEIVKKIGIDYGHRVPNHESKCYSPHGHRGVVEVCLAGDIITDPGSSEEGMVLDFANIKKGLMDIADRLMDHAFIIWRHDRMLKYLEHWNDEHKSKAKILVVDFIPTAENISVFLFEKLNEYYLKNFSKDLVLEWLKFYETPNSWAIARRSDVKN